jgi:hypothetical protein
MPVWDCALGRNTASKSETTWKRNEVVSTASIAAKKQGIDLDKFSEADVCFDAQHASWNVFYGGLEPRPGNHFSVEVRDDSGLTKIWPGM